MIRIPIDKELSDYIESLHYDYNVSINILKYLINYVEKDAEEKLNIYFNQTKEIGIELELAKEAVAKQYQPKDVDKYQTYIFDFYNKEIIFKGGCECEK